jgi:hypothetical protein
MPNPSGLRIPSPSGSRAVSPAPSCSGPATLSDLVWSYFRDAEDGEDSFVTSSDGRKHRLHYCLKCGGDDKSSDVATWSTAWTSNAKGHLLRQHKIDAEASKSFSRIWYLCILEGTNFELYSAEKRTVRVICSPKTL